MQPKPKVKVIITDVESRKALDVVNVVQRLYGYDCILCAGKDHQLQLPFIYRKKIHLLRSDDPEAFTADFKELLSQYANHRLVYLPVSEKPTRLLYRFLATNACSNLYYLLPKEEGFNMTGDKGRFQAFCETHGFPVPGSYSLADLPKLKENFRPVVLKPRIGQGSVGIRYIEKQEEVDQLVHYELENYVLQDKIESNNQVAGAFFLCENGQVVKAYTHQRLRTFPPEGGVTVYSQSTKNEEIIAVGAKVLEQLKWDGFAMIEFMFDETEQSWRIIELNPRLWGSVLLSAFNNSGMLDDYIQIALGERPTGKSQLRSVFIRWYYPFEILNWAKAKISLRELLNFDFKRTCYVNWTYGSFYRSVAYFLYFTFNFSSIKRFIKKLS